MTTIQYRVPEDVKEIGKSGSAWVRLAVFDLLGREVGLLVDERKEPGNHQAVFSGTGLSSGVYFYRLQIRDARPSATEHSGYRTEDVMLVRPMVLVK